MRCSKRFCTAPNVERCWLTASIAESISARSVFAADVSANTAELIEAPRQIVPTPTESESLAPTWKVIVTAAFRTLMPLNSALEPMRSISDASWLTSVWIACAVVVAQRAVLELDGELADALEHRVDLVQRAFRGLHHRDAVLGVAVRLRRRR